MDLRFAHPGWLWAAAALAPMTLLALRWFTTMTAVRRWSAVGLRVLLLGLLGLLLARTSAVRTTDTFVTIAVVDLSGSVVRLADSGGARQAGPDGSVRGVVDRVKDALKRATLRRGPDDLIGIVAVGERATVVVSPTRAKDLEWTEPTELTESTDLAAGIQLARALIPSDAAGRVVVFSDGVENAGDAISAARSASGAVGRSAVPIDVVPLEYELTREAYVESVDAPPTAPAGGRVTVRVVLNSSVSGHGVLRLLDDGRPIVLGAREGGKAVSLTPGRNVVALDVPLDERRVHRFRAIYEPTPTGPGSFDGDTIADNNWGEAFTLTPGAGAVLVLTNPANGEPGAETTLTDTLRQAGLNVQVSSAEGMPGDLLGLQSYDAVVLENVPAEAMTRERQRLLASFVKDLGGGLVMIGGPDSFGAGGWKGGEVEPLLPVGLDLPDKLMKPELATVFVLDNSGSMGSKVMGSSRTQQEIANEAAAVAIESLDARDLVGVIVFDDSYQIMKPLGPNADAKATAEDVRGIWPGGGTIAAPPLQEAIRQLDAVEAKRKHLVFMTDGIAADKEALPALAAQMASRGILLTTIGVGDEADTEGLRRLAEATGGTAYVVLNPHVLPKVFLHAVRAVRSPLVREGAFDPVVSDPASPLLASWNLSARVPPLVGVNLTRRRDEPTISNALATPQGEPLLAHWNVELGRVAAFTSDAGVWAREWVPWTGYRELWTRVVRGVSRVPAPAGMEARVEAAAGGIKLSLEARDERGRPIDGLDVPAVVYDPAGAAMNASLRQVGPGRYEGSLATAKAGVHVALVKPSRAGTRLAPVVAGVSIASGVEYKQFRSDRGFMERLAAAGGGRVLELDSADDPGLFDRRGLKPVEALAPLWQPMLAWTLAVFLLDLATRRVAWDRWLRGRERASERDTGRAPRTLEALKASHDADAAAGYAGVQLTEADAARVARAQVERRREAYFAQSRAAARGENVPAPTPTIEPAKADGSALLAAKRRAREDLDRR